MAFSDTFAGIGSTGATSNNQSTLDLTTAGTISAGQFVVVVVATDNIANGGDDGAVTSVQLGTSSPTAQFRKAVQIANALAAQAGASSSIWYLHAPVGLASGGVIRVTFGSGTLVDASGMTVRSFSLGPGKTAELVGTATLVNNTGADPASLDLATANVAHLRVRGIASQVGNNTNLTPTSTWTAWANGNSATTGTTAEMCARAEHIVSIGTGQASDPTYVSAIYASTYAAFLEVDVPFRGVGT